MPFLPQLIGGVEIRERRQRYAGEPRYKRLDFVRSKTTTNTDEWDLVRTTQKRYITVPLQYNVPVYQYPQVGYYPHHQPYLQYPPGGQQPPHFPPQQQLPPYGQHPGQYPGQYPGQHPGQHPGDYSEQIPLSPPYRGPQQLPFREPRMIEAAPHHNEIHDITGHDSDDDIMYEIIEPRPKVRIASTTRHSSKSRSKSKKRRPRGDAIYSSDSSSDDDSYRSGRRHRERRHSSARGRLAYDSDDSWDDYHRRYSRSRSRPPIIRGW
ncbi:hypothetical protein MMC26_000466 [Xylographa opegraphella]|nr:hypothetical protein [Xylographa opegraphella]